MSHAHHRMDAHSIRAYRSLRPKPLRALISDVLATGIPRTAREVATLINKPLVSVRARLSVGCYDSDEGPAIFREAVSVAEEGSRTDVWAYALAQVPAAVGEA